MNKEIKKKEMKKKPRVVRFKEIEGKFLHVKVGSDARPAAASDIDHIKKQIIDLFEKNNVNCLTLVTHHAVTIDVIESQIKEG